MAEKKQLDFSFLRPSYDLIELPSRGIFYKNIDELKEGTLHVRPFSAVEEKMIDRFNQNTFYDTVDEIIANIVKEDISVDDLTLGDRIFVLLHARVRSYGSKYEVNFKCSSCEAEYPLEVDLADFEPTYLEDMDEIIEKELPMCQATVKIRCPRSGDLRESTSRSYAQRKRDGVFIDPSVYQKALCCTEFVFPESSRDAGTVLHADNPDEFRYILGIMNRLHVNDSRAIDEIFDEFSHGFIDPITMNCKVCNAQFDQYLALNWDFFRPRIRRKKDRDLQQAFDDVPDWGSGKKDRKGTVRSGKSGGIQLVGDTNTNVPSAETPDQTH